MYDTHLGIFTCSMYVHMYMEKSSLLCTYIHTYLGTKTYIEHTPDKPCTIHPTRHHVAPHVDTIVSGLLCVRPRPLDTELLLFVEGGIQ